MQSTWKWPFWNKLERIQTLWRSHSIGEHNAIMQLLKEIDPVVYQKMEQQITVTGEQKENGIKDGIRTNWYPKFDFLATPAANRNLPFTVAAWMRGLLAKPALV
jgi:hypothetical protein